MIPTSLGTMPVSSAHSLLIANWILPIRFSSPAGLIKGKLWKASFCHVGKGAEKTNLQGENNVAKRKRRANTGKGDGVLVHS